MTAPPIAPAISLASSLFEAAAARMAAFVGWRRAIVAAGLGGVATLALPPVGLAPVLLLVVPAFLWLLDGVENRAQAFRLGWWFGFGYFFCGLYWIAFAFLVDAERLAWLMPFAAAALPAGLAVFCGLAAALVQSVPARGLGRCVLFACVWSGLEWLRGHLFTGFPWQLFGHALDHSTALLQPAAVIGVFGLSLVVALCAALPAALAGQTCRDRRALPALALATVALIMLWAGGTWRLTHAPPSVVPGVTVRLVQPNIVQREKWRADRLDANLRMHLELSRGRPIDPTSLMRIRPDRQPAAVLWAETATPFYPAHDPVRRLSVAEATPPGAVTIAGAPRLTVDRTGRRSFWNGLVAIRDDGRIVATYEKFHLVPFGEYFPLRSWLPDWLPFGGVATGLTGFSAGPGPRTLRVDGMPPFSPLICYEAIFPGAVLDASDRPRWLLNVTNDGWYGHTAGPHQHFAVVRLRAVEEGLPLVRVANTGISGVIDAHGRLRARLPLGRSGAMDVDLPEALVRPTVYARFGDAPYFGLLLVFAILAALLSRSVVETVGRPTLER